MTGRRLALILMTGVILGIAIVGTLRTETPAYAGGSASAFASD
jgi:hypothetical protein